MMKKVIARYLAGACLAAGLSGGVAMAQEAGPLAELPPAKRAFLTDEPLAQAAGVERTRRDEPGDLAEAALHLHEHARGVGGGGALGYGDG